MTKYLIKQNSIQMNKLRPSQNKRLLNKRKKQAKAQKPTHFQSENPHLAKILSATLPEDTIATIKLQFDFQSSETILEKKLIKSILIDSLSHSWGNIGIHGMNLTISNIDAINNLATITIQAKYYQEFASALFFCYSHNQINFKLNIEVID